MADEVMQKSAGAKKSGGNADLTTEKDAKALQGKTHECWRLKKASKDGKTQAAERVAKPWGRDLCRQSKVCRMSSQKEDKKRGFFIRICCRVEKLMRGAFENGSRSTWDVSKKAANIRVKRRGGVEV
jgi:hypothetical protein